MNKKLMLQMMAQNFCSEISEDYVKLNTSENEKTILEMKNKYFKNGKFKKPNDECLGTLNKLFKKQSEIYAKKYGNGSI